MINTSVYGRVYKPKLIQLALEQKWWQPYYFQYKSFSIDITYVFCVQGPYSETDPQSEWVQVVAGFN